jgi:hypothetical protein
MAPSKDPAPPDPGAPPVFVDLPPDPAAESAPMAASKAVAPSAPMPSSSARRTTAGVRGTIEAHHPTCSRDASAAGADSIVSSRHKVGLPNHIAPSLRCVVQNISGTVHGLVAASTVGQALFHALGPIEIDASQAQDQRHDAKQIAYFCRINCHRLRWYLVPIPKSASLQSRRHQGLEGSSQQKPQRLPPPQLAPAVLGTLPVLPPDRRSESFRHETWQPLVSYGGLARSRSQPPGPPSLRPAKMGYAHPQRRRSTTRFNGTTDRCPSGQKDRG